MNEARDQPLSFRSLDESEGIYWTTPLPQEWPLGKWLAAVYDLPLEAFTLEDLAKACRQHIHLSHIVPLCLDVLLRDPVAGELYNGEMLTALVRLPLDYWENDQVCLERALSVAHRALDEADEDLWRAILHFAEATSPEQ